MEPEYKCYRCGEKLSFIAQYQRWYCARCQLYMPSAQDQQHYAPQYVQQYAPQYIPMYAQATPPPPPPPMGHGPWPQGFKAPSEEEGLKKLNEGLRNRKEADRPLSAIWVWVMLLATVGSWALLIAYVLFYSIALMSSWESGPFFYAFAIGLFFLFATKYIVQAVVVYRLVDRRDRHVKRDRQLRSGLVEYLTARNMKGEGAIGMEVASMTAVDALGSAGEGAERGAVTWAVLCAIPVVDVFALLIVLNTLTKDSHAHDARQHTFFHQTRLAFARLGTPVVAPDAKELWERPTSLYLIISIISALVFSYYWLYVVITDWNTHFRGQWQFEDALLQRAGK